MPQGKKKNKQYLYAHKDDMDLQLLKTQGIGQSSVWLLSNSLKILWRDHQGENTSAHHIMPVRNLVPCFKNSRKLSGK